MNMVEARAAWAGLAGIFLLASACTMGPDFAPPSAAITPSATQASADALLAGGAKVEARWWRSLGDPVLDRIEERALTGNLQLAEAVTRIGRARAALRVAGASGMPRLGAAASYYRERASDNGTRTLGSAAGPAADAASGDDPSGATTVPGGNGAFDLFQAGFDAGWELDLWGRNRRQREAARADAQAAFYDREAGRVSLGAEVARVYFGLRGAEARLALLRRNRDAVIAGQRIAADRQRRGTATRYDAATAGAQVAAISAELPRAERAAADARNALALLCGEAPHGLDAILADGAAELPGAEGPLPADLPSDLARSRADIRAAEADLHAATARIGVARADFYPSITLSGSFGLQALALGNLPEWGSRQFVAGPALRLPIFEGGRLTGRLELAEADQQAAAIRYRATVLRAWHEIDDALEAVRSEDARVRAAAEGVEHSRVAAHVANRRYTAGATGYLDVIVADRARLERETEWVEASTARVVALTALYKAVGGGWTPPEGATVASAGG